MGPSMPIKHLYGGARRTRESEERPQDYKKGSSIESI